MARRARRRRGVRAALVGCAVAALVGGAGMLAWGNQAEQFTPEFRALRSTFDPKHTPRITAPDAVRRGEWFDVVVTVGAGGDHPALAEHFIRYIALYKDTAEIARIYLHPVYSSPRATFTIALDEGGVLRALAEPNHSAAWEASWPIVVRP